MGGYDRNEPLGPRRILTVEEAENQARELLGRATAAPRLPPLIYAAPPPLGYVVLTSQPDGSWQDDWDGRVHTDRQKAEEELRLARVTLGADGARLAVLYPLEP